MRYDILLNGFPGRTARGFLGWSTVVLIFGENGPILFDTGGGGDRKLLLQRLRERGIAPDALRKVVLSHLHFDHVANVECFPCAEILVHEDELEYVERHGVQDPAVPMFLIRGLMGCGRLRPLTGEPMMQEGISLIRTPGHTGGHCSVVLNTSEGAVVLAQDAIKHRGEYLEGRPMDAFSVEMAARSIQRIASVANIVVPGHDCAFCIESGRLKPLTRVSEMLTVAPGNTTIVLEA